MTELKLVFRSQTNGVLVRVFNENFKKDDSGKTRDWQQIEEQTIKEIFDLSKTRVIMLLDEFKKVCLPQHLTTPELITRSAAAPTQRILTEVEISKVS